MTDAIIKALIHIILPPLGPYQDCLGPKDIEKMIGKRRKTK